MKATATQLAGLVAFIVGAAMKFDLGGGIAAGGVALVYVGLAMEG